MVVALDRLDSIQWLRAIAALAVVAFHVDVLGYDGTWGVDLFFAISGFIICHVTAGSGEHFLAKRIIRIVPLYWLGTLGVFGIALLRPQWLGSSTAELAPLIKSLLFIPYEKSEGLIQPLLFLGWTLHYEMFFYLVFAVAMRLHHGARAWICTVFLLLAVLAGSILEFESAIGRFYTDGIVLEFAFGMAAWQLYQHGAAWRADPATVMPRRLLCLLGALVLFAIPLTSPLRPEIGRALATGLPAALALACLAIGLSGLRMPRIGIHLGDASYSLYLFHPYAIFAIDRVIGFSALSAPWSQVLGLLEAAICCALALATYRVVERPINDALRARWLAAAQPSARATA